MFGDSPTIRSHPTFGIRFPPSGTPLSIHLFFPLHRLSNHPSNKPGPHSTYLETLRKPREPKMVKAGKPLFVLWTLCRPSCTIKQPARIQYRIIHGSTWVLAGYNLIAAPAETAVLGTYLVKALRHYPGFALGGSWDWHECSGVWTAELSGFYSRSSPRWLQRQRHCYLRASIWISSDNHQLRHQRQRSICPAWHAYSPIRWQYQWVHKRWTSLWVTVFDQRTPLKVSDERNPYQP